MRIIEQVTNLAGQDSSYTDCAPRIRHIVIQLQANKTVLKHAIMTCIPNQKLQLQNISNVSIIFQ